VNQSLLRGSAEHVFVTGAAGRIEVSSTRPIRTLRAASPSSPIRIRSTGGTLDNKVAQTLAKTLAELGYVALRPNFRGVGDSEGEHDHGGAKPTTCSP